MQSLRRYAGCKAWGSSRQRIASAQTVTSGAILKPSAPHRGGPSVKRPAWQLDTPPVPFRYPVPQSSPHCMDALDGPQHHAPVRVLPHIKKLDDCLGQFLVRVVCTAARVAR